MKIVFYSLVYNHHQSLVAGELYRKPDIDYTFVELRNLTGEAKKGRTVETNSCPYILQAWVSQEMADKAMELAITADVCVFGGIESLPYIKARLKRNLLTFEMSERWLKRGWLNVLSPNIFRNLLAYYIYGWGNKPYYKLCCSGFTAEDQLRLGTFKNKCYKWGYFTEVETDVEISQGISTSGVTPLMWCSRFLMLKHPELPIIMANRLKHKGYKFILNMYGCGEKLEVSKRLVHELNVADVVSFVGNKPNGELMKDMKKHAIFLFTSDRNEGWGAVANESMSNGCVLVTSDAIGSTPYLVEDGVTGVVFRSSKIGYGFKGDKCIVDMEAVNSLIEKVEWLLNHPKERYEIAYRGYKSMCRVWSPQNAASNLLDLIDSLRKNKNCRINKGPCSPA